MYILSLLILFANSENEYCEDLKDGRFPSGEIIYNNTFQNCYLQNGKIKIPDQITLIETKAFYNCSGYVSLTIPQSVNKIEREAFYNCTDLKSITFDTDSDGNSKLKSIYASCFENCYQLINLALPNSILEIKESAFRNCISLAGPLTLPQSLTRISNSTFENCSALTEINLDDRIESIGNFSFCNCESLKKIVLSENIKSICDFSFCNCTSLLELAFGQKIESIGHYAFSNCKSLTGDLIFNDALKYLGNNAFYGCSKLNGIIDLSKSIVTIGSHCFYGAENIKGSIILPNVESIGDSAFEGCKLLSGSIEIGDSCKTIGKQAFYQCNGLKGQLILSNNLLLLDEMTFCECSGLTGTLLIPSSVTSIGMNCFKGCSSFSKLEFGPNSELKKLYASSFEKCIGFKGNLEIPYSVTEIYANAFAYCTGFNGALSLNESIIAIHDDAFSHCSSFSELKFAPTSKMTIGNRAFLYCCGFKGTLIVPNQVSEIGKSAFEYCFGFEKLIPSTSLKVVKERTFYCCYGFKGNFDFSSSYTEFCKESFCGCSGFTGELVLRNIKYHEYVFANSSGFTSIDLKTNKVQNISNGTFKGCTGIKTVKLASNSIVYNFAFEGCSQLNNINIEDVSLFYPYAFANCIKLKGPIRFSDLIESIPEGLFYNCNSISSLEIGEKIKNIGIKAFYNCKSLSGTLVLPFNIANIDDLSFYNTNIAEIIYYPPMPPAKCSSNAFSSEPKLSLSEIYIYNDFCGMVIDKNKEEETPIDIQPLKPVNESYENVEINDEFDDSDSISNKIKEAFEKLSKNNANSIKIVIVNPGVFDFSLNLEPDQYIKVTDENNLINYKEGNLNMILDPEFPLNIQFDDPNVLSKFSCKGNGLLNFHSSKKSNIIIFDEVFEVNGTIYIEFTPEPDEIIFKKVNMSNEGVFKKSNGKLVINDLNVAPYTNFSFEKAIINNTINIDQTATLEFSDQINIENVTINYKIHDFGPSNPILKGHFYSVPQKLVLNKLNNEKIPNIETNYIIASGWFYYSSCTDWLEKVDFGNSNFNEKYCHTLNTNVSLLNNEEEIYQSLLVKYNNNLDRKVSTPKTKTPMIIGIVVGSVAFVAIVVIVVILVLKYKKKQQVSNSS